MVQFFDPAVFEPGSHAALVDEEKFEAALDKEGLEALWVVAGEKSVYGDMWAAKGFGGRYAHTAVYQRRHGGGFRRHFYFEMQLPYEEQLAALFDGHIPREFKKFARTAPPLQTRVMTFSRATLRKAARQATDQMKRSKRSRSRY